MAFQAEEASHHPPRRPTRANARFGSYRRFSPRPLASHESQARIRIGKSISATTNLKLYGSARYQFQTGASIDSSRATRQNLILIAVQTAPRPVTPPERSAQSRSGHATTHKMARRPRPRHVRMLRAACTLERVKWVWAALCSLLMIAGVYLVGSGAWVGHPRHPPPALGSDRCPAVPGSPKPIGAQRWALCWRWLCQGFPRVCRRRSVGQGSVAVRAPRLVTGRPPKAGPDASTAHSSCKVR